MGIYHRYVLPWLIHLTMQNPYATAERKALVPLATGTVLEVGIGSGLNLPFYTERVDRLVGVDPSVELWHKARKQAARVAFPVEHIGLSGERIPVADRTFDTVVTTWTLCSIPDPMQALAEMRRVLKPDGRLLFIEHGLAPDHRVQVWQHRLTPLWRRIAGGCHLNREIESLIRTASFDIIQIETGYVRGPKFAAFHSKGLARPVGEL